MLVLLGFAATDFVITKTLSAADAAEHLITNPVWPLGHADQAVADRQRLVVTMGLLVLLGAVFLRGFKEVIGLAVVIVGVYLVLNLIVVGAGLAYLAGHPDRLPTGPTASAAGAVVPASTTRVSGTGIGVRRPVQPDRLPQAGPGPVRVRDRRGRDAAGAGRRRGRPEAAAPGRIRNTRRLLLTAAAIMSVFLLGSSLVVSTLIEPAPCVPYDAAGNPVESDKKPPAADRALAYLAHGEARDGRDDRPVLRADVRHGRTTCHRRDPVVRRRERHGRPAEPRPPVPARGTAWPRSWARAVRPLVILFTVINLLVTWIFGANVKAQGDAYATGVLALITSACVATVIDRWRARAGRRGSAACRGPTG